MIKFIAFVRLIYRSVICYLINIHIKVINNPLNLDSWQSLGQHGLSGSWEGQA